MDGGKRCPLCGRPMYENSRRPCCNSCLPKWVGKDADGYAEIYRVPLGERRMRKVRAHTWVMEQHLGRKLIHPETVHHKNGKRIDFRLENLELWSGAHGSGQRAADIAFDYMKQNRGMMMGDFASKAVEKFVSENGFEWHIASYPSDAFDSLPLKGRVLHPISISTFKRHLLPDGAKWACPGPSYSATFSLENGLDVRVEYA